MSAASTSTLANLREHIQKIEGHSPAVRGVLPFGAAEIDNRLPGGGLVLGALHEVAGAGQGAMDAAASALFAAGIAARTRGKVLWCVTQPDLFPPGFEQVGLESNRLICVEAGNEQSVLSCFEEGLRYRGLGAVIAEVAHLSMTASRRLQMAAEDSGVLGIAVRRWRTKAEAFEFGQPTAATTRWRVSSLPSGALPVSGIGRARWRLELVRSRGGHTAEFEVEACDATGHIRVPSHLADGQATEGAWSRRASA